jgi:hypothetical protein
VAIKRLYSRKQLVVVPHIDEHLEGCTAHSSMTKLTSVTQFCAYSTEHLSSSTCLCQNSLHTWLLFLTLCISKLSGPCANSSALSSSSCVGPVGSALNHNSTACTSKAKHSTLQTSAQHSTFSQTQIMSLKAPSCSNTYMDVNLTLSYSKCCPDEARKAITEILWHVTFNRSLEVVLRGLVP